MKYYKIIQDNNFIGVACSINFVRYQTRNHLYVISDETHGEFVECNGKLYRSTWMLPIPNANMHQFEQATILEISEQEYLDIRAAIDTNEEIIIDDEPEEQVPVIIDDTDPADIASIEFVRSAKINEMSYICRTTIEAGFDLELRNEVHHFSLDTQDQLNLISLSAMAQTQSLIPYHADGEACIFYTTEEINEIVETATAFKIYHTTYYNALKGYINALETIEAIAAIEYGTPIPEEYKSDVLRALEQ